MGQCTTKDSASSSDLVWTLVCMRGLLHTGHLTGMLGQLTPTATLGQFAMRQETETAPTDENSLSALFGDGDGGDMPSDGGTDNTCAADTAVNIKAVEHGVDASAVHRTGESVMMESIFDALMSQSEAVESLSKRVEIWQKLHYERLNDMVSKISLITTAIAGTLQAMNNLVKEKGNSQWTAKVMHTVTAQFIEAVWRH